MAKKQIKIPAACIDAREQAQNARRLADAYRHQDVSRWVSESIRQREIAEETDRAETREAEYRSQIAPFASALEDVEKKARVRTCNVSALLDLLRDIRKMIGSKKACEGVRILWRSGAQKFPSAYKYLPEGTIVHLHYHRDAWIVDRIYRGNVNYANAAHVEFPDDATAAVMARLSTGVTF